MNIEVEGSRFISSTRLSSFFSQPPFPDLHIYLAKLKIHLQTKKRKGKLRTIIWNQIHWSWSPEVMLLCWSQSMGTAESNEDWKESLRYLRSNPCLESGSLLTLTFLTYPCLTALIPAPGQVILFSTNLCNNWLFLLCGSLLKTHVTPPAFFDSAQRLSVFLRRSCFLYLQ